MSEKRRHSYDGGCGDADCELCKADAEAQRQALQPASGGDIDTGCADDQLPGSFVDAARKMLKIVSNEKWLPIETAPKDGRDVLAAFQGQFRWVMFTAQANPQGVVAAGYASPTHWQPLPAPPGSEPVLNQPRVTLTREQFDELLNAALHLPFAEEPKAKRLAAKLREMGVDVAE